MKQAEYIPFQEQADNATTYDEVLALREQLAETAGVTDEIEIVDESGEATYVTVRSLGRATLAQIQASRAVELSPASASWHDTENK